MKGHRNTSEEISLSERYLLVKGQWKRFVPGVGGLGFRRFWASGAGLGFRVLGLG